MTQKEEDEFNEQILAKNHEKLINPGQREEKMEEEKVNFFPLVLFLILLALLLALYYYSQHPELKEKEWFLHSIVLTEHDTVYVHDTIYLHDTIYRTIQPKASAPELPRISKEEIYRLLEGEDDVMQSDRQLAANLAKSYALKGDARCQFLLGRYYYRLDHNFYESETDSNYRQAFKWFKMAAESGDKKAMIYISEMYRDGIGTPVDTKKADIWSARAK